MKLKAPQLYTRIKSPLFISLLFFVFFGVVTEIVINQYQQHEQQEQLIYTEEISHNLQSTLEASINDTFHLHGLRAYLVATQGKIRPDELNAILANYFPQIGNDHVIRNIGVAPNDEIQYIFPLTGNEKALGLRLIDLPKQWPMTERAIQEKLPVLIGPLDLVQGVLGLIYSVPVFITENNYWGSISAVTNADKIFSLINEKIAQTQVQVALRGRNGEGEKGEVFWGDASLFDGEGVRSTIKVPGGSWQLVVKPAAIDTLQLLLVHLTGLLLAGLLATLFFIGLNASRQRIKTADKFSKIACQVPGILFQYHLRLDGNSCFPFVSDGIRDVYRLNPEDILDDASKLFALIHPDDLDNVIATIQKSAQELLSFSLDHRVLHNDGKIRWLSVNALPQREADGSTLWYGFTTDITERKQVEDKLRLSNVALKHISQGVIITNHKQNILWVNDAFESITGHSQAEIWGQNCRFLQGPLTDQNTVNNIRLALKNSTPFAGEILNYRKDGSMFWNDITISSVFDAQSQLSYSVGTNRDLTERKKIQHALHESEFLWKFAIEGAGDGVWDWNIQTHQVVYSRLCKEMLGYSQDEIDPTYHEWLDRLHPDDRLTVTDALQAYLDGNTETYHVEYRLRCKDESYKWIMDRGVVVDYAEEGTPLRMIGTQTDISKRKHQEQQDKEHLSQLAHVTRLGLMGEMASGIAHEVNQPLTAIATYTQASLNLMKAESPNLEKLAEIVYKTQQQALRAGQIIRRMREFVKSNTKQVAATDLNELIQDAAGLCLPELKLGNITLTLQLQSPLPLINVDKIQIEQVIINLIRNSADAFDSCLENRQKEISIDSLLTLNEGIEVRVKDNGPGIPDDQQPQILMPFYTTKTEGMGMGLSICCSIIEAHEGHLKFNSQVGKGTTFYFTLPIKKDNL
jgi:PAS domain S-box-containing protein